MAINRRPATRGQQREALVKMAADEAELSRRTGNYKEQSTAGASERAKTYLEPVIDTTLNVTSLAGPAIGATKMLKESIQMVPVMIKGVRNLLTPKNAAKTLQEGKGTLSKTATEAEKKAVNEAKKNIYEESPRTVDPIPPASGAGRPRSPGGVQTKPTSKTATKAEKKAVNKAKRNIYEEDTRTVDPIPPTSDKGRPRSPGGIQTKPPVDKVPLGAKVAAAAVPGLAVAEALRDKGKGNVEDTSPKSGQPGSAENPKYVGPTPKVTALKKEDKKENKKADQSSFEPEPDPKEDPSAWRKWNFKRVKVAEKTGVKPSDIAKSSMDKEIAERSTVSDKKGGRIKTSPKVKRAVGGMVKPKKKTSSARGVGCAQRGYGKAMMGGGKVKAYKAGGKVGGNRLY
jgi:hypothetical protein